MSIYIHKSHNVTVLLYHLVFPAKYRRAVFDAGVDQALRDVCLGMLSRRQPRTSSKGRSVRRRNSTTIASSASVSTVLRGLTGPIGRAAVVARRRHLATVFGFSPWRAARRRVASCDLWSSARTRGVVRAEP